MKLNVMLGLVASLSFTTVFGAAAFEDDDAALHAAIAASLEGVRDTAAADLDAALAASMSDVTFDAPVIKAKLSARQLATWFADTTGAIGSGDLRLIHSTLIRLQSLEEAYELTPHQVEQLTDNITRLVQVVSDLESKAALGSQEAEARSAARRSVASSAHVTTKPATATASAPVISGSSASSAIGAPSKSFAELRAMFDGR